MPSGGGEGGGEGSIPNFSVTKPSWHTRWKVSQIPRIYLAYPFEEEPIESNWKRGKQNLACDWMDPACHIQADQSDEFLLA